MNVSNTSQQYPCSFPLFFPSKWAQATWNVSCLCCACCAAVDFISASTNIAYLPQSHNHHHSPAHHLPSQHIVSHSTFHFLLPAPSHTQSSNYWWLEQPRRLRARGQHCASEATAMTIRVFAQQHSRTGIITSPSSRPTEHCHTLPRRLLC